LLFQHPKDDNGERLPFGIYANLHYTRKPIPKTNLMPVKILVCEDDLVSLKMIEAILLDQKFDVILAKDGLEAIRQVDKGGIDLVITDIHMPYHSGDEVLKRIRSGQFKDTPVIMLSVDAHEEVIALAKREGVNEFIKKPVKRDDLQKKVKRLLKTK
jgi:CheY-like chemotaxis protein